MGFDGAGEFQFLDGFASTFSGGVRVARADFDGDGIADLAVVDRHLPGVQILANGASGLQRALAVPVFETPPSEHAGNEPRDLAAGDLDGDGRTDFVLIAHDRILIYLQEP
jgi:hypothetical protein